MEDKKMIFRKYCQELRDKDKNIRIVFGGCGGTYNRPDTLEGNIMKVHRDFIILNIMRKADETPVKPLEEAVIPFSKIRRIEKNF